MTGSALVPLNVAGALPRFAEAGVREVYVGFHDGQWDSRFGARADLNRMSGFGLEANPFAFGQMLEQLEEARELGIGAYVCFNAAHYSEAQVAYIRDRYLPQLARARCAGVIVSSQALVAPVRAAGLDAVVSTLAGVFNARLAAHYRDLGAARLILPRDLSVAEIEGIVRAVPGISYEVFLMRNGCLFSDSHCLGRHCLGRPSLCTSLREGDMSLSLAGLPALGDALEPDAGFLSRARANEETLNRFYHRRTCGLCALWRFEQLEIAAYKVVGRGDDVEDLLADAALVVRNAALADACADEAEYHARMERPRVAETLCGYGGLSCYYPECSAPAPFAPRARLSFG